MIAATTSLMPLLRRLDLFVTRWHRLVKRACDGYRPERHYMRGPGPKSERSRPISHARALSVLIESEPGSNLLF